MADVKNIMGKINTLQNATDRARVFFDMSKAASEAWDALKELNPDEVKALADEKSALEGNVKSLRQQQADLQTKLDGMQDAHNKRMTELSKDYQSKQEADASTYSATVKSREDRIAELDSKITALESEHANKTSAMNAEATQLQNKINGLKQQMAAMLHA